MWCTCKKAYKDGFSRIDRKPDSKAQHSDLWGHHLCSKPHYAYFKKLTGMRCPYGAKAIISVFSRSDGINELTFALASGERKTVLQVAKKPTVLERLWEELDTTMDSLMNVASVPNPEETHVEKLRIRARTQAETLAILMDPFFTNADQIAREAQRRWKARKAGDESYETPGLSGEEYVPPEPKVYAASEDSSATGQTGRQTGQIGTKAPKAAPRGSRKKTLPQDGLAQIKQAVEVGMFSISDISRSYGVPEETVKQQLGLE